MAKKDRDGFGSVAMIDGMFYFVRSKHDNDGCSEVLVRCVRRDDDGMHYTILFNKRSGNLLGAWWYSPRLEKCRPAEWWEIPESLLLTRWQKFLKFLGFHVRVEPLGWDDHR